jgi:hypothetical protein
MSPIDAAKLLDLPSDATPEQLEARFNELRQKLEDKIAKAPTPGLKAKYRESLDEITLAFETLTLAADSSSLPVTHKQGAGSKEQGGSAQPAASSDSGLRSQVSGFPAAKRKSGSREFALVAFIAVALLAAGGWFVMKTRAESAEQARVAAELKAEADRQAEAARVAAEAKKKAEEEEKVRVAAAAKAEQDRLEKLAAQVRVGFSESKLLWQQAERTEREAQRELDDLKNSARSMRDATAGQRREAELRLEAQTDYQRWLSDHLARHPARRAEVRTEELLNTRQTEAAAEALAQYQQALAGLTDEIASRKPDPENLFGSLAISSTPAGITWELTDAFGRVATGTTPGAVNRVGIGPATVTFRRPGWAAYTVTAQVPSRKEARAEFTYRPATLTVTTQPAGAAVFLQGKVVGQTPLTLSELPIREQVIEVRLADHKSRSEKIILQPGETTAVKLDLLPLTDQELIAEFTTRWKGTWAGTRTSSWLPNSQFSCKFEPASTYYVQTNTSGENAGKSDQISLTVSGRAPLRLNRTLIIGNEPYVIGYFLEEAEGLVLYSYLPEEGKATRIELKRISN